MEDNRMPLTGYLDPVSPIESRTNQFPAFSASKSETDCHCPVDYSSGNVWLPSEDKEVVASAAHRRTLRRHNVRRQGSALVKADRREHAEELLSVFESLWKDSSKVNQSRASRLREGFLHRTKFCGVEVALKWLKSEASENRSKWILNKSGDFSAQASFIGRALPKGNHSDVEAALEKHYKALTEAHTTDPAILARAREFSRKWARQFLSSQDFVASPDLPTLSSCSEARVSEGGLRGFASKLGEHPDLERLVGSSLEDLPYQDAAEIRLHLNLLLQGKSLLDGRKPSVVVPLPERGLKVRVITKSPASMHFLGHIVRKRLLQGLAKDPASAGTLSGVKVDSLLTHLLGSRADVIVSTDLTSASDLLPLDLISAVVDGLSESGRLPKAEVDILRILTGPQEVIWPATRNQKERVAVTRRGILMGLPTTWAILSLIHLFWWHDAIESTRVQPPFRVNVRRAHELNRFQICGDDAIFIGWRAVATRYAELVRLCGGQESKGKHFVSDFNTSPRAVFLEKLFQFYQDGTGKVHSWTLDGSIPLKGLVRPEVPTQLVKEYGSRLSMSTSLRLLFSINSLWQSSPNCVPRLLSFLEGKTWLYGFANSLGLTNGLPIHEGGSGLPTRTLSESAMKYRYRVQCALGQGESLPSLLKGIVDPNWKMACELARSEYRAMEWDRFLVIQEEDAPKPSSYGSAGYVQIGSFSEFDKLACLDMFNSLSLQMGVQPGYKPRLRERAIKKAVSAFVNSLPELPSDWTVSSVAPSLKMQVWAQRTYAPSGRLIDPRWSRSTRATAATLRAKLLALAWTTPKE